MPNRFRVALATLLVLLAAVLVMTAAAMDRSEITRWLTKHDGVAIVVATSTAAAIFPLLTTIRMWTVLRSARRGR